MKQKAYNVFISHYSKDDYYVKVFKRFLRTKGYFMKNSSIDSTKPNRATNEEYIKRLLRMRIQWAGTMVVLIGPETHTRDWVNWEIEQAYKKGKRIVGVFIRGCKGAMLPLNLELYGNAVVGWHADSIIGAIQGKNNNFSNPDGSDLTAIWKTPRHDSC